MYFHERLATPRETRRWIIWWLFKILLPIHFQIYTLHGRWINKSFLGIYYGQSGSHTQFYCCLKLVWTQNLPKAMAFFKICLIMISCLNLISWKDIWPFVKTFLPFVLVWTPVIHFATFPPLLFPRLRGSGGLTLSSLSYKRWFPPSSLDIASIS